eukprot:gene15374-biopygen16588
MTLIRTPTGSPGRGSLPDPASASLAPGSVADSDADSTLALLVAQLNLKDADIDILCETLRTRYTERFVSSTPAAASAAAGSATHSLASSAALLAQQQAAALIASAAAGGQLQHVTNGNVEQLVPGATVAAANLLTSGVVPPAGVSNVAVAGGIVIPEPEYRFSCAAPVGLYGSVRGVGPVVPAQFIPARIGSGVSSVETTLKLDAASRLVPSGGWTMYRGMPDAKLLALAPNMSRYELGLRTWFRMAVAKGYITSVAEGKQYQVYVDKLWAAYESLTNVGQRSGVTNHDLVMLTFIHLDNRLREAQYTRGCSWDVAFDDALLSSAVVELTLAVQPPPRAPPAAAGGPAGAPRAPKAGSGGAGPSGSGRGKYCFAWANTGASALDSPAGLLCYRGSAALAPCATADPSTATTSVPAPAVVAFVLPDWQRAVWARRPLCVELFDTLSAQDVDRSFLMGVVRNGVLLVPDPAVLTPYCLPNYSSALQESSTISNMLAAEVAQSWVVQVPTRPRFVHPLGAVPKSDGGIRVIHDHSVPLGSSVNDHEVYVRYSWDSLDDALQFVVPHVFMARLDVSAYYRHFMVHPSQWDLQGFEFGGAFYVDNRVQFGLRLAPELAHRFTMFIKRVLHANGVQAVVGVMDDYLLLHADYRTCLVMLAVAVALLSDLGFDVNLKPGKTVLPAKVQKFVGVVINSARMSLSLPSDKLSSLLQDVTFAVQARTLKRKFLQRLVGKMQWASRVIYGGRVFMRSCTDALSVVLHPGHHASVSSHMRADLRWWLSAAAANNGIVSLARRRRTHFVFTDACLSPVPCIGIFAEGAFFSLSLSELARHQLLPPAGDEDINVWECFAVLAAVRLLGDYWSGAHVVVFSDNASTVAWVGQGAPRPPAARQLVGVLFQACLSQDIRLSVRHIPGVVNVLADALSRKQWDRFAADAPAAGRMA